MRKIDKVEFEVCKYKEPLAISRDGVLKLKDIKTFENTEDAGKRLSDIDHYFRHVSPCSSSSMMSRLDVDIEISGEHLESEALDNFITLQKEENVNKIRLFMCVENVDTTLPRYIKICISSDRRKSEVDLDIRKLKVPIEALDHLIQLVESYDSFNDIFQIKLYWDLKYSSLFNKKALLWNTLEITASTVEVAYQKESDLRNVQRSIQVAYNKEGQNNLKDKITLDMYKDQCKLIAQECVDMNIPYSDTVSLSLIGDLSGFEAIVGASTNKIFVYMKNGWHPDHATEFRVEFIRKYETTASISDSGWMTSQYNRTESSMGCIPIHYIKKLQSFFLDEKWLVK